MKKDLAAALWQTFERTGNPLDYMEYCRLKNGGGARSATVMTID
jgi:hypothetical protein